jgi:hypothetical protein
MDLELEVPFENLGEIKTFLERLHEDLNKERDTIFIANGILTLSTAQ